MANATREVSVENPCEDPNELPTCGDGTCTVSGFCVDSSGDGAAAASTPEPPPVDTTPPIMQLRGNGEYGNTPSGMVVLVVEVMQGSKYTDEGVDAYDVVGDNNTMVPLTANVFGNDTVDTWQPFEGEYQVIRYTLRDEAGNEAPEVQRWIKVVKACPKEEGDGDTLCSSGKCSNAAGSCDADIGASDEPAPSPPPPPTIQLLGEAFPVVPADAGYSKCPPDAEMSALCDRGATATSKVTSDLNDMVEVCGKSFKSDGLDGCATQLAEPGIHEIVFSVTDSAEQTASVTRKVKKLVSCPDGYEACADEVTCTPEGVPCAGDLETEETETVAVNNPPAVTLKSTDAVDGVVLKLPRFKPYAMCGEGNSELCEPGVTVQDEEADLLDAVVACAPDSCMSTGCKQYRVKQAGIAHCLNTSAPVDSVFPITFTAYDSAGLTGSVTRTINIVAPCAEGETWCPEEDPKGKCEAVTCAAAAELAALSEGSAEPDSTPKITLLTPPSSEGPFLFLFGQRPVPYDAPYLAGPVQACANAYANLSWPLCGARASSEAEGDLSATVTFKSSDEVKCSASNLNAGKCEVGEYTFSVSATSNNGEQKSEATGNLAIHIVEGSQQTLNVTVQSENATDCSAALSDATTSLSVQTRASVADAMSVPVGGVHLTSCTSTGASSHIFAATVVQSVGKSPAQLRRNLGEATRRASIVPTSMATKSPATSGPEYIRLKIDAALVSAKAVVDSTDDANMQMRLLALGADESTGQMQLVTDVRDIFQNAASGQANATRMAQELLELTEQLVAALEALNEAQTITPNQLAASMQLLAYLEESVASRAQSLKSNYASSSAEFPACNRSGLREDSIFAEYMIRTHNASTVTTTTTTTMTMTTTIASMAQNGTDQSGGVLKPLMDPSRRGRKLLRVSARGSRTPDKSIQNIQASAEEALEGGWAGYIAADDGSQIAMEDLAQVNWRAYRRPRSIGAVEDLRVIGGMQIRTVRRKQAVGCQAVAGRFSSFLPRGGCGVTSVGAPFGYDPSISIMGMRDSSGEILSKVLYEPSLEPFRGAFYDTGRGEIRADGKPYAFYNTSYEYGDTSSGSETRFDVFITGVVSGFGARKMLTSIAAGRFMDNHTETVTVRMPMHNAKLETVVDLSISFSRGLSGEILAESQYVVLPIRYYFQSMAGVTRFVMEILVAIISMVLVMNQAHAFAKRAMRGIAEARKRQRLVVVKNVALQSAWTILSDFTNVAMPSLIAISIMLQWWYSFEFVRTFTYEDGYQFYDNDGSAKARLLLPKRLAPPQDAQAGVPGGAYRSSLPLDASSRDAYVSTLERIDSMTNIWYSFLFAQAPIVILIAGNIFKLLGGSTAFYAIVRSTQRGMPDLIVLSVVMIVLTWGCAFIVHIVIGDRVKLLSKVEEAHWALYEYVLGDLTGLAKDTLAPKNVVQSTAEYVCVGAVFTFYPLVTVYMLAQFYVAIVTDLFCEERGRIRASEEYRQTHASEGERIFNQASEEGSWYRPGLRKMLAIIKAMYLNSYAAAFLRVGTSTRRHKGKHASVHPAELLVDLRPGAVLESILQGERDEDLDANTGSLRAIAAELNNEGSQKEADDAIVDELQKDISEETVDAIVDDLIKYACEEEDRAALSAQKRPLALWKKAKLMSTFQMLGEKMKFEDVVDLSILNEALSMSTKPQKAGSKKVYVAVPMSEKIALYDGLIKIQEELDSESSATAEIGSTIRAHGARMEKMHRLWSKARRDLMQSKEAKSHATSASERREAREMKRSLSNALSRLQKAADRSEDLTDGVIDRPTSHNDENSSTVMKGNVNKDGLTTDAARWLRMNQADRYEIQLPVVGTLGAVALGEVICSLHQGITLGQRSESRERLVGKWKKLGSDTKAANRESGGIYGLVKSLTLSPGTRVSGFLSRMVSFASKKTTKRGSGASLDKVDYLLYSFVPKSEYALVFGEERAREYLWDDRSRAYRELTLGAVQRMIGAMTPQELHRSQMHACSMLGKRVVYDVGSKSGSEFLQLRGAGLVKATLQRGRDTARGMCSITVEMCDAIGALIAVFTQMLGEDIETSRERLRRAKEEAKVKAAITARIDETPKRAERVAEIPENVLSALEWTHNPLEHSSTRGEVKIHPDDNFVDEPDFEKCESTIVDCDLNKAEGASDDEDEEDAEHALVHPELTDESTTNVELTTVVEIQRDLDDVVDDPHLRASSGPPTPVQEEEVPDAVPGGIRDLIVDAADGGEDTDDNEEEEEGAHTAMVHPEPPPDGDDAA